MNFMAVALSVGLDDGWDRGTNFLLAAPDPSHKVLQCDIAVSELCPHIFADGGTTPVSLRFISMIIICSRLWND